MNVKQAYDYDDVLIVPKPSIVNSRDSVSLESEFFGFYPIFSAPMKGISGFKLVSEMSDLNCLGIYHRFDDDIIRENTIKDLKGKHFGIAIGIKDFEKELKYAQLAELCGANLVCVDVANGYTTAVLDFIQKLKKEISLPIMAGNVVTVGGATLLAKYGANFIRVGIGGGTLCSTRNVTGIGVPQLTAVEDCNKAKELVECFIVSDGGISDSGKAVKSFACGADFVMLGSLLANAEEAENNGMIYGMASKRMQENYYDQIKSNEGIEMMLDPKNKRPLKEIISEFLYGIKSACTYLNCRWYGDIQINSQFVSVGNGTLKKL